VIMGIGEKSACGDPARGEVVVPGGKLSVFASASSNAWPILFSIVRILSWRVFWTTMLNCSVQNAPPTLALSETEIHQLDHLVKDKTPPRRKRLSHYLTKVARLGGYLVRANAPPPGNTVMWCGQSRLTDIALSAIVGAKIVDN
jgi:hypothetical protein